ncbi:polysaccharide biosynthesis C-terminal domain-containing protein, partial [Bacillus sp. JJ1566]|uniref:MATE family efflux transporter n=1 Tax=Bacillus sp. JJ1566 TaxID=3122961 RepID=UPI003000F32E
MQILRPVLIILFVFIFSRSTLSLQSSHLLAITFIVFLILFFVLKKSINNKEFMKSKYTETYNTKEWLFSVVPLVLFSGMDFLQKNTDILMIGALLGTEESGLYTVATRVTELCAFGMLAVNSIAAPMISNLYSKKDNIQLQKIIRIATQISFIVTLIISLFLIVLGKKVLFMFGIEFVTTYPVVLILLLGQLINAYSGPVSLILTMTGYYKPLTIILLIGLIINLLLNLLLLKFFGIEGAAIATAVSKVFNSLALIIYIKRKLDIKTSLF